jgi:hypothetical protein
MPMPNIDLTTLSYKEKYQLYQELERDLGIYPIDYISRDEVEELIGDICDNSDEVEYPWHECIEEAIARVIPRATNLDHAEILEWIAELSFEIDDKRLKDSLSPYRRKL